MQGPAPAMRTCFAASCRQASARSTCRQGQSRLTRALPCSSSACCLPMLARSLRVSFYLPQADLEDHMLHRIARCVAKHPGHAPTRRLVFRALIVPDWLLVCCRTDNSSVDWCMSREFCSNLAQKSLPFFERWPFISRYALSAGAMQSCLLRNIPQAFQFKSFFWQNLVIQWQNL